MKFSCRVLNLKFKSKRQYLVLLLIHHSKPNAIKCHYLRIRSAATE